jgi:hypothetical protein
MRLVEVESLSPGGQSSRALQAAPRAVELTHAGLWKDAWAAIALARAIAVESDVPALQWNDALIELHAKAMAEEVTQSRYPLLSNVFYGDYDAALELMRPYRGEHLFGRDSPLVAGTVAEGWEQELAEYIIEHSTAALSVEPRLAGAYFLRGWAGYLGDPGDPQVQADLARAAALDPQDPLFVSPDVVSVGDRE